MIQTMRGIIKSPSYANSKFYIDVFY